ncbi:hypothetical protein CHLNCDRAFT_143246 [Chlorella variabilis]|uniref:DUF1348 domain-containing protein n=1 Tax=Chlorella variabilis TaxID=554065 RepID=E1Z9T5_CHLVA|nr:hypothetical protein CHLNCDRAFT_143246 [Chlorella variabilis]EFN57829.1 hypothetical protein CHLNCDRAFT_143246 [Chlorella variabilis]|eukprot:XP_005849931.1 hypothetical protein CHLNCDRAFT_143246 [Chlorella variabilis]
MHQVPPQQRHTGGDPDRVALAYTIDTEWRNRAEFVKGREAVRELLRRKWEKERHYVLRKYYFGHVQNRISVCFEYEYQDEAGQWYRAYGNENWEFAQNGLMRKRIASINEAPIAEGERRIAVDSPTRNTWLAEQGVGGEFPLGGGSKLAY